MNGAFRYMDEGSGFEIRSSATISGTFYTDPTGQQPRQASDPDATKQYVLPGFAYRFPVLPATGKYWPIGLDNIYRAAPNELAPNGTDIRRNPYITGPN
jgi:hypothetical protein